MDRGLYATPTTNTRRLECCRRDECSGRHGGASADGSETPAYSAHCGSLGASPLECSCLSQAPAWPDGVATAAREDNASVSSVRATTMTHPLRSHSTSWPAARK